jgi:hypothetical protein
VLPSHTLQLFDEPQSYTDAVSSFVSQGLAAGEAVIVVATSGHWALVNRELIGRGVDPDAARSSGKLTVCDAQELAGRLIDSDTVNEPLLCATLGDLVTSAKAAHGRVRMYGEFVDVLARRGLFAAAEALEQFWNTVADREGVLIFCGYTAEHFGNPRDLASLRRICALHTHAQSDERDALAGFLLRAQAAC